VLLAVGPVGGSPEEGSADGWSTFESEFVASDVFRSGSLVVPVVRRLSFDGDYFGGTETDTGLTVVTRFAWDPTDTMR